MNRRSFISRLGGGISGSFLLGTSGGMAVGVMGAASACIDPEAGQAKTAWSENGEDLIVESICRILERPGPTYLDIGAADPTANSNTYLFYRKGCRGVLVEPNPSLCKRLAAVRPGDTVLNVGIGPDDRTEADYYMLPARLPIHFPTSGWKSWRPRWAIETSSRR